jgi:hypothetical protein
MHVLLVVAALLPFGVDPAADQLLLRQLVETAERTKARLESEGATWTVRVDLENGVAVDVEVDQFPQESRHVIKAVAGGKSETIATVIARDGVWYVDDGASLGRYRPFESPFPIPTAVFFLLASQLHLVPKDVLDDGSLKSVEPSGNRRVVLRLSGTDLQNDNLRSLISKIEGQLGARLKAAGKPLTRDQLRELDELKARLSKGFPMIVDQQTAVVLDRGLPPKNEVHCRGFSWTEPGAVPNWHVESRQWKDFTRTISANELRDVIQIGHSRMWRPGNPTGDTDLMLFNVRTGMVKRAPFPFGTALSGCFSRDRTRIYVSGTKLDESAVRLFEINIMTGETRLVGDEALAHGIWMNPVLSPDGTILAAMQIFQGAGLSSQLHVIDLGTSKSEAVGKPMDVAYLNWHPDGKSLLSRLSESNLKDNTSRSFILQVTLDGQTRKLRKGDSPRVLPMARRILFEDPDDDRLWKTCDFEGQDSRLFGDGFKGFGFPTPSSDGRLLMMKFVNGKAPQPCLIDLDSFEVTPIEVGPGIWGRPAWR